MSQLQVTGEAKIRDIQGPVVANSGVITALDGAASQYVRGDGTLADFPTSSGGGSSVSYYLNSSVSQGTIGGVAYRELSKDPIIGAGTDIPISANGYVANYITDVNDPDVTIIPGGNFNCEFYFSVNNNTGSPTTYAELYKYDGTTFTLLGTSAGVPESINQGTTIAPYYFAIPVATASLSVTDRLAIRIYVNVSGRTVTLHTENGHLCQVVTTLSKGMVSLNNLTDQSQYLTTGTSGTDFNIVSSGDTHTFNIPSASASNRGLITTGNQTIAGIKTFNANVQIANSLLLNNSPAILGAANYGALSYAKLSTESRLYITDESNFSSILSFTNTADYTYTFPAASGTLALTSNLSSYVPYTGATDGVDLGIYNIFSSFVYAEGAGGSTNGGILIKQYSGALASNSGYTSLFATPNQLGINFSGVYNTFLQSGTLTASRTYTLPDISGTLALLEGSQTFTGLKTFSNNVNINQQLFINGGTGYGGGISYRQGGILSTSDGSTTTEFPDANSIKYYVGQGSNTYKNFVFDVNNITLNATRTYSLPDATGTIALTSNLSSYVPYTGATTNVNLGVYSLTANQLIAGGAGVNNAGTFTTYDGGVATQLIGSTGNLKFFPFWNPSIGARINAENSAGSAYIPLSFYATAIYLNAPTTLTGALSGTSATFSSSVTSNATTSVSFYSGTYVSNSLGDGSFATYSGRIRENASFNLNIDLYDRTAATWRTPLSFNNTGGAATFSSDATVNGILNNRGSADNVTEQNYYRDGTYEFGVQKVAGRGTDLFFTGPDTNFNIAQRTSYGTLGGTVRFTVASGGNVGIGTASPNARLSLGTGTTSKLLVYDGGTIAQGGNGFFAGFAVDYPSGNDFGMFAHNNGALVFGKYTNNNDLNTVTERMRITSGGNVLIGKSTTGVDTNGFRFDSNGVLFTSVPTGENTYYLRDTTNAVYRFYVTSGGTINATNTTISAISDVRLKENITDLQIGLDAIMALRPRQFDWKKESGNDGKNVRGFIAQEFEEVFPDLIDESINKTPEGEPYKQIRQDLIPILVKAIQELKAEIDELKNK